MFSKNDQQSIATKEGKRDGLTTCPESFFAKTEDENCQFSKHYVAATHEARTGAACDTGAGIFGGRA
jgi:hypothetical protein